MLPLYMPKQPRTAPHPITSHAAITPALAAKIVSQHMAGLGRKGGRALHERHPQLLQLNARVAAQARWSKPGAREAASRIQREAALKRKVQRAQGRNGGAK